MKCLKRFLIFCALTVWHSDALSQNSNNNRSSKLARIRASTTSIQKVKDMSGSLEEYMQLPASQYSCVPMPLKSSLDRVIGTRDQFRLCVPPMKLKSPGVPQVEVRPLMMAKVNVEKNRVLITSDSCQIRGSKIIEDLNINDFFDFKVKICLTWDSHGSSNSNSNPRSSLSSPSITARSEIGIDLNPPGLFAFLPRKILEDVGNRAIGISLKYLQNNFMISLASDFERWSVDDEYRLQRKQLELDMEAESRTTASRKDETLKVYL